MIIIGISMDFGAVGPMRVWTEMAPDCSTVRAKYLQLNILALLQQFCGVGVPCEFPPCWTLCWCVDVGLLNGSQMSSAVNLDKHYLNEFMFKHY